MATKAQQAEQAETIERLRKIFPKGSTVHTVVRHVSRSGMQRSITVLAQDGRELWNVSGQVARALGWRYDNHDGVTVKGCGMDMTFHLVYSLSQTLYGAREGYALKHRNI